MRRHQFGWGPGNEALADDYFARLVTTFERTEPRIAQFRGEGTNVVRLPRS